MLLKLWINKIINKSIYKAIDRYTTNNINKK